MHTAYLDTTAGYPQISTRFEPDDDAEAELEMKV